MPKALDLLLEYRQDGSKNWAIRFYQNGLVKQYSDSEMNFEDGKIVTHPLPPAWREIARLSPAELDKFLAAMRKADLFSLPEKIGHPNRIMDGVASTWIVNLDGQKKTIQATGPEASNNPALKLLREMIQEITADAFDRQAGEE
jgi:hypothetical protein